MSEKALLEAVNLSCERDERALFTALSFRVDAGEWVQVTGANGAGKTTLLRILSGLSHPDSGDVLWKGVTLADARESFSQDLLWLGHQPGMKTRLTALENLRFYHPRATQDALLSALAHAGLAGYEDLPLAQLSAGQQRRAALARLWLTSARLWLLDEPFTAIDADGVSDLTRRLAQHTAEGGMVVMTTHQPLPAELARVRLLSLHSSQRAL